MNNGLLVKEIHQDTENKNFLTVNRFVRFDVTNIESYKNKLTKAKTFRQIDGEFDDNQWILHWLNGRAKLDFSFETNESINIALKCYSTILIHDKNMESQKIRGYVNKIKKILHMSNFLNPNNIDSVESYFSMVSDSHKFEVSKLLLSFIAFYGFDGADEYTEFFSKHNKQKDGVRLLPDYRSILSFDYVLNHYMSSCDENERERFLPLLLWWDITRVIPMRPVDLTLLDIDCAFYDKNKNSYYIKIERSKAKSTPDNIYKIPLEDTLKITKDIYDLINEYKSLVSEDTDRTQLLSYKSYVKFLEVDRSYAKYNPSFCGTGELELLLDDFYYDVIVDKYNYIITDRKDKKDCLKSNVLSLDKIELGDTRHFAFCSLILQGLNPLTIAKIGGHSDLSTQMSYYGHLDNFIESNVYVLSEAIKLKHDKIVNSVFDTNELIVKSKVRANYKAEREVEGGRCFSKNFPNECICSDCIFCEQFILDLSKKTYTDAKLKEISNKLGNEIKNQIKLLKTLAIDTSKDTSLVEDTEQNSTLKSASNELRRMVSQKANIDSYRLKKED